MAHDVYKSFGATLRGKLCSKFFLSSIGVLILEGVSMAATSASSSSTAGVPPGFRFHPTDEELLLYYLKKKISFEKFDLEVIREVDLNKIEPWDLQESCRIGSTPQNEWYFFSHKDRKYPTGSRTNRATNAGFWKATGRDKCIRNTYKKIGMRKTLVFYRGRAPHGQKTDWIMHEYRLEDADDSPASTTEDGWVVCRVFKKKCFFKLGSEGSSTSQGTEAHLAASISHDQARILSSQFMHPNHYQHHHHSLYYSQIPPNSYSHVQVQDLLTNHRPPPAGYDFSVLPAEPGAALDVGNCDPIHNVVGGGGGGEGREQSSNEWAVLDGMQQMGHHQMHGQRGGEMDLWGYGK